MSFRDDIRQRGAVFIAPDAALLPYVSGYHAYAAGGSAAAPATDWFFPGWANVRFTVDAGPWHVSFGDSEDFRVPDASLFGPSSRAIRSVASGGVLFGAGLTPLGYASLISRPAQEVADRVIPLPEVWSGTGEIQRQLSRAQSLEAIKAIFDAEIARRLTPPRAETRARVEALHGLLVHEHSVRVEDTAARLGLAIRTLNRVTTDAFGFSPKLLLRRSRFLKSLMAALREPERPLSEVIDSAYFDHSHFIRDSNDFLGMPPQRFLDLVTPLMRQSMTNRSSALGGPVQALHTAQADT